MGDVTIPESMDEVQCTREEFRLARFLLEEKLGIDVTTETQKKKIQTALHRRKIEWEVTDGVMRILEIASIFWKKYWITISEKWASDRILRTLDTSNSISERGIASRVRAILDGVILSAPTSITLETIGTIIRDENLSLDEKGILLLAKIQSWNYKQSDLATFLNITEGAMTHRIRDLRDLWYLEPTNLSSKKKYPTLTMAGKELIAKIEEKIRKPWL